MDFSEAEVKFNELQARVQRGEPLSEDQYQEELAKLMVQDEHGTFWSLEPGTGRWLYFDGTEWVPGTPPRTHYAAPPRPPAAVPLSSTPPPTTGSSAPSDGMSGGEPPTVEPETVPTYVRAGETPESEAERAGGIPPRPVREATYAMGVDERPWLPFAMGAIALLLCAVLLFFGVRGLPTLFGSAAARVTPTEGAPTAEATATGEVMAEATDTPEAAATATTVATAAPKQLTGTAKENLRARNGPGTGNAVLTTIPKGTSFTVTGRNADNSWLQVQIPGGSNTGWVSADFVTLSGDVNSVPVVSAPKPATTPAKGTPTKRPTKAPPTETPAG